MDASLPEFLLLFVIGLLVLGPERMAQVAKKIGHFVGYARRMSRNFQVQLEDELEMKQIRDSLPKRVDLKKELGLDGIEDDIRKIGDDIESSGTDTATQSKALPAASASAALVAPGDQPDTDIVTQGDGDNDKPGDAPSAAETPPENQATAAADKHPTAKQAKSAT